MTDAAETHEIKIPQKKAGLMASIGDFRFPVSRRKTGSTKKNDKVLARMGNAKKTMAAFARRWSGSRGGAGFTRSQAVLICILPA